MYTLMANHRQLLNHVVNRSDDTVLFQRRYYKTINTINIRFYIRHIPKAANIYS